MKGSKFGYLTCSLTTLDKRTCPHNHALEAELVVSTQQDCLICNCLKANDTRILLLAFGSIGGRRRPSIGGDGPRRLSFHRKARIWTYLVDYVIQDATGLD